MTTTNDDNPNRLDELMVDAATEGLSPQDEAALSAKLRRDPSLRSEAESYELAAAAIDLALTARDGAAAEPLPAALREKLVQSAASHVGKPSAAEQLGTRLAGAAAIERKPAAPAKADDNFSWTNGALFGWYAAAAALIALAVLLVQQPGGATTPAPTPTLAQRYDALAQEASTLAANWMVNPDGGEARFANAAGEVIWNPGTQTGYMKLAGLPVNDPTVEQYQLWIVDPTRDAEPIDGGVFDITATGEVIVPIDAKLVAKRPTAFAISVEQPGGVVVSEGPPQVVAPVASAG